jgi:hypothetical protein
MLLLAQVARVQAQPGCPNAKAARVQYSVKIDSTPPGASIYIDADTCSPVGTTPWTGKLNPGALTVIIKAPGYITETKTFNVAKLRPVQSLVVALKVQPRIEVRADADKNMVGATVFVDGQANGQVSGPVIVSSTVGRHLVEIKKDGFEVFSQWVDLTTTPSVVLTPALKEIPKFGTITVDADVPDAEIIIDGTKHPDNTPASITNVREGVHVIEVKKNGQSWTKTIQVVANQAVKVRAELTAGVGVIRVMSDTPGARAFIDGIDKGPVPVDIKDIKAGDHIIQIKASGYKTHEEMVNVTPGSSKSVKHELGADEPANTGKIRIITTQPNTDVTIDGVPWTTEEKAKGEVKRPAGEYSVQGRGTGNQHFEQKVTVEAGKTASVTVTLKASGKLRILTTPPGADVTVNGVLVGKSPVETDADTGDALIQINLAGFNRWQETIKVEGTEKVQVIPIELAAVSMSDADIEREQKGLSSFGARTLPRGRATVDMFGGYPYYGGIRINVGAGRLAKQFGFDVNVGVRTNIARSDLGIGARAMLSNADPFSAGVFTNLYWGSKLFDDSFRNGVTWDVGGMVSLTALTNVTITGHAYAELWSDRHCPSFDTSTKNGFEGSDPIDVCVGYAALRGLGPFQGNPLTPDQIRTMKGFDFTEDDARHAERLTGNKGLDFFKRDNGARFVLGLTGEFVVDQHWNVFVTFDGLPFQRGNERALFTKQFSGTMADSDFLFYGQMGLSYKF